MQGNKFSGAPPGLNWVRRLDPRTKLRRLMPSLSWCCCPGASGWWPGPPDGAGTRSPGPVLAGFEAQARAFGASGDLQSWSLIVFWLTVPPSCCGASAGSPWALAPQLSAIGRLDDGRPHPAGYQAAGRTLSRAGEVAPAVSRGLCPGVRWVPEDFATAMRGNETREGRGLSWEQGTPP